MRTLHQGPLILTLCAVSLASSAAFAQPAADAPAAPAGGAAPAAAGATPAFELREAPDRQLTGMDALAPQPGGLTSAVVAKKAVASSPTLDVRQAEIEAAEAKVDDVVAQFLPRLKLTATYRRISPTDSSLGGSILGTAGTGVAALGPCPDPALGAQCPVVLNPATGEMSPIGAAEFSFPTLVNHYVLNAQLALPLSDYVLRLSRTMAATRANQRSSELFKRAEELKIASDARIAYYNWLRTVAGGAVARSSLERVNAVLKDARTAFELGTVTRADVLRLEAHVASTEFAIAETEAMRAVIEEQLATLMDEPVGQYQVGEDIRIDPARITEPEPLSKLVAEAHRSRIELRALAAANRSLREAAGALRVSQYPRLDAFGDLTYANPNTQVFPQAEEWNLTWAVGLSLSYTINDAFGSRAQAAELDAMRRKLEADRKNLERGLKLEVTAAYHEVRKARAAIESSSRGSAAAQEAYRVARELYRAGRATTTDLIQAEGELVAASLKEVDAALGYHIARLKLEHAVGRDVPSAS